MSPYRIAIVPRPAGWTPRCPDDLPPLPAAALELTSQGDDLFALVSEAVAYNQRVETAGDRWAVVTEPGSRSRLWDGGRLCTPISYKVAGIWWPEGWEPSSPLDVPNCTWRTRGDAESTMLGYDEAENSVRSLNRQCLDALGSTWYVLVAVEHEPHTRTISLDAAGSETTVEVRPLHVVHPTEGGRGDCRFCPAHEFPCSANAQDS